MEELIIQYGLLALLALFILSGMIWGLIRGLKKTLFRGVWLIATAVLLFFLTPVITWALMDMDVSFLGVQVDGIALVSVRQLLSDMLSKVEYAGQLVADNPQLLDAMLRLALVFVNLFVYVILFFVLKILLWPLWAILSAVLIKKKDRQGMKKKRHRFAGMLVGIVVGVFVCATALMPAMGLADAADRIERQTAQEASDGRGMISEWMGEEFSEYLKLYQSGASALTFRYTGIEGLNRWVFQGLTTTRIEGKTVSVTQDVYRALEVYRIILKCGEYDFGALTQEQLNELLAEVRTASDSLFEIGILNAVGDVAIPYLLDGMANDPDFFLRLPELGEGMEALEDAIPRLLNELKTLKFSDLKQEASCLLDAAQIMNEKQILLPILRQEEGFEELVLERMDQELVDELTEKLLSTRTLGAAAPILLDAGISYAADYLGLEDFRAEGQVSAEQIKSFFRTVFHAGLTAWMSIDPETSPYVKEPVFDAAGTLLDAIRNYPGFTADNYAVLMDALEGKLKTLLDESFPAEDEYSLILKENLFNVVNRLSEVESFAADFARLGSEYEAICTLIERVGNDAEDLPFAELGRILDAVKSTQLFGDSVVPLLTDILEEGKKAMEEYPYLADAMDAAIANLGAVTSWAEEMECFSGFRTLTVLVESTDLRGLITEEGSTFLHDLGAALDGFECSTLLGGQIKGIVSGFLDDEALTGDIGMVRDALDRMKANLESGESFVWADEFSALAELLPVLLELPDELTRESAEDIGSALDRALACGGRLLDKSVLDAAMKSALDEVAEGVTEIEISGVVESLKALVEGAERLQYEGELTALYDLFDEVQKLDTTDLSSLDFASLGECLDQFGPDGERTSVLAGGIRGELTELMLGEVKVRISDVRVQEIVQKMIGNVPEIVSYKEELVQLKQFMDRAETLSEMDGSAADDAFTGFGAMLDGFEHSALLANVRGDMVLIVLDGVSGSQTDPDILAILDKMKANVPEIVGFEEEFAMLKRFSDQAEALASLTADSSLAAFREQGALLDSFASSALLANVRADLLSMAVDRIEIASDHEEINAAVEEILDNTKTCAGRADAGESGYTYSAIFEAMGSLRDMVDGIPEVVIDREHYGVAVFGAKLEELDGLIIVPHSAVVRISKSVTERINEKVETLVQPYLASQELNSPYTDFMEYTGAHLNACEAYLNAPEKSEKFDFSAVYIGMDAKVAGVMEKLPG